MARRCRCVRVAVFLNHTPCVTFPFFFLRTPCFTSKPKRGYMTYGNHFFPSCLQKQTQSSLGVTHLTTGGLRTLGSLLGQEQVRTQYRRQTHMRHPPNPLHPLAPLARIRRILPRTPQIHRIPHTRYSRPMRSEAACTLRAPPRRRTPAPRLKPESAP